MIRYIFGAYFKQFSLSFPDVNKKQGVAETAPLKAGLSVHLALGLVSVPLAKERSKKTT